MDDRGHSQLPEYFGTLALVYRALRPTWNRRLKPETFVTVGTTKQWSLTAFNVRNDPHAAVQPLELTQFDNVQWLFST